MQRASSSFLRSYIGGAISLESSLQRAVAATSLVSNAGSCSALPTPAYNASSLLSGLNISGKASGTVVRFAGDYKPAVAGSSIENWSKLRAAYDKVQPNSLGGNYYLNILVMGFAYWLNDAYYFPSRTVYIGALVFFCLYVRRSLFTTPLAHKTDY